MIWSVASAHPKVEGLEPTGGAGHNAEYDFVVKPGGKRDRSELALSEPVKLDHGAT